MQRVVLVSLVSVWGRNWCYLCGTVERVPECETVESASIDAVFLHLAENMVGWRKRLGEYPTLSATSATPSFSYLYILGGCLGGCDVNLPTKRLG